ncbi:MAG: hypothetical protein A2289_06820 [Deltaproteobacteria bacterium RIFOXYA12_FULL_58_15]|nr:MAG: hypothetical protein A2289_06820 [Deltaproteobacteria bacterium RIFOXYA12_FULL_58_15]OGR14422.1 MAG: hypothetical protein A2341_04710 [Deltaproteobacteria bacterium RIFOXYB12_FULL_58_9]
MLRFEPEYKMVPWGGRRLEDEFGRTLPDGPVGESWELVDLENHKSCVAQGPHMGKTLGELWRAGAMGGSAKGAFPFLLKWLNSENKLSVQVHPDESACENVEGAQPKTESWFVAHTEPGATLLLGHYPGIDPATLRQAALGGTVHKWLYEVAPRVGDMFHIPAGTLHAMGAGFVVLEVQQPSDTTYRVYDWGRVGLDGEPREIHLDQAIKAVHFERAGTPKAQRQEVIGPCYVMRYVRGGLELPAGPLRVLVAHSGAVGLATEKGDVTLEYGDVAVAEPSDGKIRIASGGTLLLTEPNDDSTDVG